jgi:hypothetical protein
MEGDEAEIEDTKRNTAIWAEWRSSFGDETDDSFTQNEMTTTTTLFSSRMSYGKSDSFQ